jgi:hypothetical protein
MNAHFRQNIAVFLEKSEAASAISGPAITFGPAI